MTKAAEILDEVFGNTWEDCLDLRKGMNALMRLKTTMDFISDDLSATTRVINVKCAGSSQGFQSDDGETSPLHFDDGQNASFEQNEFECPQDYDMFLDQLLTKATSQEGFVEAFENILPEPVQLMVDKLIPALKSRGLHDSEKIPETSGKWKATDKAMLGFMAVMGLLSMSILTAMGMSADCGCVCATGETPKYIWGISLGLVSALPIVLMALCLTVSYVLNKVRINFDLCFRKLDLPSYTSVRCADTFSFRGLLLYLQSQLQADLSYQVILSSFGRRN